MSRHRTWPGFWHAALRPWLADKPELEMESFNKPGYIEWSTGLCRIPKKYGVNNVHGELGAVFASTAVTNPRCCATFLGQRVNMRGSDRVVWGTDSVWYGSPQWQIEALRRLEIPEDIMKSQGWTIPPGGPGSEAKRKILGLDSASLYNLDLKPAQGPAFGAGQDALLHFVDVIPYQMLCSGPNGNAVTFSAPSSPTIRMSCSR